MSKRLAVLLAILLLPTVVQASGTPGPPINPCTNAPSYRCKPAPPAPCSPTDKSCQSAAKPR